MPLGTSYGYPVKTADELGLTDYFRKNPKVAGMAWGGGLNGTDVKEPRVIVANPFNRNMADPNKMQGLLKIEAARHFMDETGYAPEFELSEEQQEWRKTLGKAYAEDDLAAKQTVVSRVLANDKVPGVTPEQKAEADRINAILDERENPSFISKVLEGIEETVGAPRPWELTPGTSVLKEVVAGEGSLKEKGRKGLAKFVGRYATNIADPAREFDLPSPSEIDMKAVIADKAPWLDPSYYVEEKRELDADQKANEVVAREMFDLPSRIPVKESGLKKIGKKTYTTDGGPLVPEGKEEGLHFDNFLGRYLVVRNPKSGELEYEDVWDISSPVGGSQVKNPLVPGVPMGDYGQENDLISVMLRNAISPMLRPATVKGKTTPKSKWKE